MLHFVEDEDEDEESKETAILSAISQSWTRESGAAVSKERGEELGGFCGDLTEVGEGKEMGLERRSEGVVERGRRRRVGSVQSGTSR